MYGQPHHVCTLTHKAARAWASALECGSNRAPRFMTSSAAPCVTLGTTRATTSLIACPTDVGSHHRALPHLRRLPPPPSIGRIRQEKVISSSTITIVALLALLMLATMFVIGLYNKLVALRNCFKNAYAQIDVQLKRRYDLIPNWSTPRRPISSTNVARSRRWLPRATPLRRPTRTLRPSPVIQLP